MNEQIISDLQVMSNVENKLGEISEKIGAIEKSYPSDLSNWGTSAKKKFFSKVSESHKKMLSISEELMGDKILIEQARMTYEKAENVASQAVGKLAEKAFSTANMFRN